MAKVAILASSDNCIAYLCIVRACSGFSHRINVFMKTAKSLAVLQGGIRIGSASLADFTENEKGIKIKRSFP